MLILIDGYNVIAPVAGPIAGLGRKPPADWLHRERMKLIDRLATCLGSELASQTCVVFDAAARPWKARGEDHLISSHFRSRDIEVRFAIDHNEADDLIEELIAAHATPKRLTVVSSDRRLKAAARRSGASAFDSQSWLDDLLDNRLRLAIAWPPKRRNGTESMTGRTTASGDEKEAAASGTTTDHWMQTFAAEQSPKPTKDRSVLPCDLSAKSPPAASNPSAVPTLNPKKRGKKRLSTPDANNHRKLRRGKADESSTGDPKRLLQGDNLFPDGYGEDLL